MSLTASEKSPLSTADVCLILDASAKAGVTELQFGGLHVKFGRGPGPLTEEAPLGKQQDSAPSSHADMSEAQHQSIAQATLERDEISLREEQLARALVEDPDRYEELLARGELSDELDGADEQDDG